MNGEAIPGSASRKLDPGVPQHERVDQVVGHLALEDVHDLAGRPLFQLQHGLL